MLILRWRARDVAPGGGANAVGQRPGARRRARCRSAVVGDDAGGRGAARRELDARANADRRASWCRPAGRRRPRRASSPASRTGIKQQIVRYDREDRARRRRRERDARSRERSTPSPASARRRRALRLRLRRGASPSWSPRCARRCGRTALVLVDSRFRLGEFRGARRRDAQRGGGRGALRAAARTKPRRARPGRRAAARAARRRASCWSPAAAAAWRCSTSDGAAHVPVHGTDQVADVTGAGDTVIGTFALALAAGADAARGGAARQLRRRRRGDEDGHRDARSRRARGGDRAPIRGRSRSCGGRGPDRRRARCRGSPRCARAGRRIALANGHFDLLHVGHLRYLRGRARRRPTCSWWRSTTTTRWRGSRAPAGRSCRPPSAPSCSPRSTPVDFVVVFAGRLARRLCSPRCGPTCTAREPTTARPSACRSTRSVRAYGGRTALVGDPKDHATSDLIARVRALP